MKTVIFSLFGIDIQLWVVLTGAFSLLYVLFSILGSFKRKKIEKKRKSNAENNT